MRWRAILIITGAALLTCCGERAVTCNYEGEVIIPADAAPSDKIKWMSENSALAERRMNVLQDKVELTRGVTRESLQKADSCP